MSINFQGRDGHTGDSSTCLSLCAAKIQTEFYLFFLFVFSSPQRMFPWSHPPGAVPAGQRSRHEPRCLRPQQVQRGEGGADVPDVGV